VGVPQCGGQTELFFGSSGFEHLLCRCFALELHSSPFCLSYFSDRVSTLCWNSLDCSPAIYASHLAAMTGMCPLGLIFESGLAWNWRSSCLRPLSAEITSVNHHTRQVLKHRMVVHAVETILRILIFSWNVGIRCYTVTVLCSGRRITSFRPHWAMRDPSSQKKKTQKPGNTLAHAVLLCS
jgi:hypothetical protein